MTESVEEAMEYIKGYCLKHFYCEHREDTCRFFDKDERNCSLGSIIPADWEIDGGKDGEQ